MRLSLSWLKEFTGQELASDRLAHNLTMAGLEVEGVEDFDGDTVLELSITPNRSDCLSVAGIAKEVAAIYNLSLPRLDSEQALEVSSEVTSSQSQFKPIVPIIIEAPELCHRYAAAVLSGVKVAPSPNWLAKRLEAAGIRPINNIVDVTNYVCIELGQPLHAFDLARLRGPEIRVRQARDGEKLVTLDGKERSLDGDMLVIADALAPVAVAGVMGGLESEVTIETQDILLESAWFLPSSVRRTAKKLKLHSEASHRFERGVDESNTFNALLRAVELIKQMLDCSEPVFMDEHPAQLDKRVVSLRPSRLNKTLGTRLGNDEIIDILRRLGFKALTKEDVLSFEIPSRRADICYEHDLIEEVARIYGFDNIPSTFPNASIFTTHKQDAEKNTEFYVKIRQSLVGLGFFEAISYSFCSQKAIEALDYEANDDRNRMLPLQNPISDDLAVMRTTLFAHILGAVKHNLAHAVTDIRLFELGTVFYANNPKELPCEEKRLCAVWVGARNPVSWALKSEKGDFFDLKGALDSLLSAFALNKAKYKAGEGGGVVTQQLGTTDNCYIPGTALSLNATLNGCEKLLGTIGEIAPSVLSFWDINVPVFAFDLNLDLLFSLYQNRSTAPCFRSLPRFPWIERDVAFVVKDNITSDEIDSFFRSTTFQFLENHTIFDVYAGKPVPDGHKSLAIRFRYQALDHTLEEDEIAPVHDSLVRAVLERFNASIRA